jgi:hypothetical protein
MQSGRLGFALLTASDKPSDRWNKVFDAWNATFHGYNTTFFARNTAFRAVNPADTLPQQRKQQQRGTIA